MRVAIIYPCTTGPIRGNITTVHRIVRQLSLAGLDVLPLQVDALSEEDLLSRIRSFKPDLIHAFHIRYCGPSAEKIAARLKIPCMITVTGSDINEQLFREDPVAISAVKAAASVVCFDQANADAFLEFYSGSADKLAVIPQGVVTLQISGCGTFGIPDDAFVLFLPAALRPVKRVEFAIKATERLAEQLSSIMLVIAGGIIDQPYAESIRQLLDGSLHSRWLGEVPYDSIGCVYSRADIVLNCSSYEGMSNSLLEAMSLGRPLLASDIPSNRTLIKNGINGFLFNGQDDFCDKVLLLHGSHETRDQLGRNAQSMIRDNYSPQQEAEQYIRLYRKISGMN